MTTAECPLSSWLSRMAPAPALLLKTYIKLNIEITIAKVFLSCSIFDNLDFQIPFRLIFQFFSFHFTFTFQYSNVVVTPLYPLACSQMTTTHYSQQSHLQLRHPLLLKLMNCLLLILLIPKIVITSYLPDVVWLFLTN